MAAVEDPINVKVKAEGKRRLRMKENGRFALNPHVVPPQPGHYLLQHPLVKPTFPDPLPVFLPRSVFVPSANRPRSDNATANAGQFFTPVGGIRKSLRRNGHHSEYLVYHIELALMEWLHAVHVKLNPEEEGEQPHHTPSDEIEAEGLQLPGRALWDGSPILEVDRSRKRLVWHIEEDAFARYVVHCCCRFHSVVSYSKDMNGRRFTFLLRPSRGCMGVEALATPTATDYDSASSIGDYLDGTSLGGMEPDMEDKSHLTPVSERDTNDEAVVTRQTEEIDTEADLKMEMEEMDISDSTSRRMSMQYRWTRSLLTDIKKPGSAYAVGFGRGQSLWSYVFS